MTAEYLPFFAISLQATTRNMLADESTSIVYSPSDSVPAGAGVAEGSGSTVLAAVSWSEMAR